jgi:hypothetical protein
MYQYDEISQRQLRFFSILVGILGNFQNSAAFILGNRSSNSIQSEKFSSLADVTRHCRQPIKCQILFSPITRLRARPYDRL